MCPETRRPPFEELLRFVARIHRPSPQARNPTETMLSAARAARRQLRPAAVADPWGSAIDPVGNVCEVLELLAASSDDATRPSELMTVRGFRVRLDYSEGDGSQLPSICVLVQCPEHWIGRVQGRVAYLWNGAERCELGEFDADGKAIGILPAAIEMTVTDLAAGRVRLEAPGMPAHE